ncbi:MAG TPA: hypothetical protein VFS34_07360, partial [Thermoanaerobaculia bacterium]|nr:hypothetical protein [Thermoanaerobaculia bacterium]
MIETAPGPPESRLGRAGRQAFLAAFSLGAAAVVAVVIRQLRARPDLPLGFAAAASAVAAAHAATFAFVFRRRGTRAAAVFLGLSIVALAGAGGWRRTVAMLGLAGAAALSAAVGDRIGALILPKDVLSWGARLGFGILAAAWAVSALLLAGVFGRGIAAAGLVVAGAFAGAAGWRERRRNAGVRRRPSWTDASAAAAELFFLLGAAALVGNLAPESGFDALTRYLPWVKIAARTGAFPRIPWQFPFILP